MHLRRVPCSSDDAASPRAPHVRGALAALALASAPLAGCLATTWGGGKAYVSEQALSAALGDDAPSVDKPDRAALPVLQAPHHVRPCCAFGMDLPTKIAGVPIPGYTVGNILDVEELGRHEYDNGFVTLNQDLTRAVTVEKNGLVYTCRGGFVDVAHVRDNADLTLYLATRIAIDMWGPTPITVAGDGAIRRIVLKPIPKELIERVGPWEVAVTLAQWASFQLSIWHEIVTWYGYESIPGFSEKVSAFSLEDLYSNALGMRIAGGILRDYRGRSRAEWNDFVAVWIERSVRRLVPAPVDVGRGVMKSLDGLWWDSHKSLPDWTLVMRRNYDLRAKVTPWRRDDAGLPADAALASICGPGATALSLSVPERIGDVAIADLASVELEVGSWATEAFPFADPASRKVTNAEFPRIVERVRREAQHTLGPGFDQPGPRP
jgi:hypothetical protein